MDTSLFTPEQLSYLASRGANHGLSAEQVLSLMDPDIAANPALAMAKLRGSEMSHIISQSNAPGLAETPSNIVLEPADGTNQARGADSMSPSDIADVEFRSELQDFNLRSGNNQAAETTAAQHHHSLDGLFDFFRVLTAGHMAVQRISPLRKQRTVELGAALLQSYAKGTPQQQARLINQLREHMRECAGAEDVHAAFLLALVVLHCPWALPLLAARGLCTLARMATALARQLADAIFSNPNLAWARNFITSTLSTVHKVLVFFETALTNLWEAAQIIIDAAAAITSAIARMAIDVVVSVYQKGCDFVTKLWSNMSSLFNWKQLQAA
jgi:hypothetical protein